MENTTVNQAPAADGKPSIEEIRKILAECDKLHSEGKLEESLQLASGAKAQSAPAELMPYVLEMQVRNMYDLMMYQSALKLLDQILKYMPVVKDFLFRKIQCEIALAKTDEARTGLEKMKKSIEEEHKEKTSKGEQISQQDLLWRDKVESLLARLSDRKNRDLNKIRVYFKEVTGEKLVLEEYLEKARNYYSFEESDNSAEVSIKSLVKAGTQATVDCKPKQLKVAFTNNKDSLFSMDVDLFEEVDPRSCNYEVSSTGQLTIHLHKLKPQKWGFLEEQLSVKQEGANKANLTHTQKSWAQICSHPSTDIQVQSSRKISRETNLETGILLCSSSSRSMPTVQMSRNKRWFVHT